MTPSYMITINIGLVYKDPRDRYELLILDTEDGTWYWLLGGDTIYSGNLHYLKTFCTQL